jgi:recombination protein RecA
MFTPAVSCTIPHSRRFQSKENQMPIDPKRSKSIDDAIASIEKQFGKGAIMKMGDADIPKIDVISTGSLGLDIALGIGGLPKGRISEIYGPESSGKTTIALQAIAQCQKQGGVAAFIDAEHALDLNYAAALGVQTEELLISQPDCGEQALEIAETLVRSNAIDIVVIDSVAALVPRAEINGDMGDCAPGAQARLMSQAMRKLTAAIHKSHTSMLFINQLRMKIGVMFGSPEVTSGGNALKFYASIRLDIRRIGAIKNAEGSIGNRTRVKVVKNKLAPPFRQAEFDILYGKGVNSLGELVDLGADLGLVRKAGSWYSLGEDRIGQGRDNAVSFLSQHENKVDSLRMDILGRHGIGVPLVTSETPGEA